MAAKTDKKLTLCVFLINNSITEQDNSINNYRILLGVIMKFIYQIQDGCQSKMAAKSAKILISCGSFIDIW